MLMLNFELAPVLVKNNHTILLGQEKVGLIGES